MPVRFYEFDLLRVMATFAAIAIHVTAGYLILPGGLLVNQLVRFAVPLFIVISGFLIFQLDLERGLVPIQQFYRKRFHRVLWPYIAWSFFYTLLSSYMGGSEVSAVAGLSFLKNLPRGTAYYHLYFLTIIFQLYLIYPFMRSRMGKNPHLWLICSLVLTLICQLILQLSLIQVLTLPAFILRWYTVAFPNWLFYFVLGMFTVLNREKIEGVLQSRIGIMVIAWLISLGLLLWDGRLTGTYGSSVRPSIIFYTWFTFLLLYSVSLKIKPWGHGALSWLSSQSFIIYLAHPAILTLLFSSASRMHYPSLWSGYGGMALLFMATIFLTLPLCHLVSLSPLAVCLGATPRNISVHKETMLDLPLEK